MQVPGTEAAQYLPSTEMDLELIPLEETPEVSSEPLEASNLLTRIRERIVNNRKVTDVREDFSKSDSKTRTVLSGAGVVGLFATGPLKLGTIVPLAASMEVLQTSRPGLGGVAAGIAAGIAGGATYGAVVRGGTNVINNGVEHFPRTFSIKEDESQDVIDASPDQRAEERHGFISNLSLGVKCNMMSTTLMLAETTQGRSKKELTNYSKRLSWAGAFVMVAASTTVAETVVVSGHPELAREIQDKIHDFKYLGSLTLALLAIDGVNYLRRNGLSSIRSKLSSMFSPALAAGAQKEIVEIN